ncbi:MAG: Tex family protein [Nannocystaceae bacterium]
MGANFDLCPTLAGQLGLADSGVRSVLQLLDGGATVPFIARYRKEMTGNLDEQQIRAVADGAKRISELGSRRAAILRSLAEQGVSNAALLRQILAADDRRQLEELYLPHKPKRRSKASVAEQRGLGPLATRILAQPASARPDAEAHRYLGDGLPSLDDVWAGAHDIMVDTIAQDATLRSQLRDLLARRGILVSKATNKANEHSKFRDYFSFGEAVSRLLGHRYLALRRGEAAGELRVSIELDGVDPEPRMLAHLRFARGTPYAPHLLRALKDAHTKRLRPIMVKELRSELGERFDHEAVGVFGTNLRALLLAAPLGQQTVVGIDPGLRTGCKCVVVDETGKFIESQTLYLLAKNLEQAEKDLRAWLERYRPVALAVGNGTGGRDAEAFVRRVLKASGIDSTVVSVNEAGASVYSASDVAREEFPLLDITVRGAISIARRLQDPLAELVKIDPQSIGVGQYQHDVPAACLGHHLDAVVEDCVSQVGVQLNSASAPLLARVAGVGPKQAQAIVQYRDDNGPFRSRRQLLKVPGMGPKKFEQCAGFLRVSGSRQPLDDSAVHPERYALVERIASDQGVQVRSLIGSTDRVGAIEIERYTDEDVGVATLTDILSELREPGRDPRTEFEARVLRDDVVEMSDLKVGMELEGVVTNVAAFGAFIDVGVHQDGLVHVSRLQRGYVSRPSDVVTVGQKLRVWVLDLDERRRRISLSAVAPQAPTSRPSQAGK